MRGNRSANGSAAAYLRRRATELATPATRATSDPLADWSVKNIRLDGRPFSFAGHEYLRGIYNDTSPHIVLSKAAQIGGTVWALLRSIHACLNGLSVVYYFPTRTDVIDFSKARVGPLLYDNPFLLKQMTDTDTAGLKRIGAAHLYFRGMQSSVGMKSVPADMIVFDELDEATPDARAMAWERLAHSDYKRVIELSNPSLPGYGIDEQYEKSDQRHWTLKCPSCGEWTCLEKEFPTKLRQEVTIIRQAGDGSHYRACPKCASELDLSAGEWVADYPDRKTHGYRISQLFSGKVDPGEILSDYQEARFPDRFYNLKIGIPWADLERRLDIQAVLDLCGTAPSIEEHRWISAMGVDTGKDLHVVILQRDHYRRTKPRIAHVQTCREFHELDVLMRQFNVQRCVIDGMPETHATRDFARRYSRGDVFLSFFNESQRGSAKWDRDNYKVEINRTEALDASRAIIREQRIGLPPRGPEMELFARHLAANAKVLDEDPETGARKYKYVRTAPDHYSLAFTYGLMALTSMPMPLTPEQRRQIACMMS